MKEKTSVMIEARRNLAKTMMAEGKSEAEIYKTVRSLKYEPLITEIHNAEWAIEHYAKYYHAREYDCPDSFKYLMLVNGWHSPFVALNELLKRIDTNEQLMKREKKRTGEKPTYKSRYKELRELLQKEVNNDFQLR